ncbi:MULTISPECIES: DedA family protein [Tatumella]|uniref:DedA family protein n=1 Tax=Tatumella punctata TaxID=399969 RepID=A0ABW1VMM4_9GAMM|nr:MULTISPECIES: DedA family protein [unclassified Tatumella]MBS0854665.1 DedA family protein [Tatumella sp. JGM16]MBS0875936.1 DedA family protein [Tatumella sp. JGM82]MBS0890341.1 DedA family protein [Tatumella sp. JGM94]MBS0892553.1 DedA family protein [Tatumella sp. JGM130]MBS0900467.1 DedA family protein [Tatumella sp. JGM100]
MHIDINSLISHYGYLALLIGCMAEGETFVLLGGIAANKGLLHFAGVVAAAMAGGIIGDQLLYWLGRRYGSRLLAKFSNHQDKVTRASQLIHRYPSLFVIGVRFMYGFRIIGPIIIGSSQLSPRRFLIFNIIGAFIWALLFVSLGYFAGKLITPWFDKLDEYLKPLFWVAGIGVVLYIIWKGIRFLQQRRHQQ